MAGPDLDAIAAVANSLDAPVLAAGGIAAPGHIREVAALGVEGAIVGRALYEGVPFAEFLRAVGSGQPPGGT
jgi:phosphoribosylformimino-5-aminoimidazole carboxamide ribonucleotide (ProFAR) isomerase